MNEDANPTIQPDASRSTDSEPVAELPPAPAGPSSPPPPFPGQQSSQPVKRLYRDPNGSIGGVAAGVAHYFDLDVTVVRLLFVLAVLATGTGLLAYLIAWIVVPASPHPLLASPPAYGNPVG